MRVVLATNNEGKLADFRRLLAGGALELSLPADHGVELDVEETGSTFRDNALLKARAAVEATGLAALADDSGLTVDALGGAPGVYSARYAGEPCDDYANNEKVLAELVALEREAPRGEIDRGAAFVCVLALVRPDGRETVVEGRCRGTIAREQRGSNGFGYDAIFFREDLGRTFGESTPAEKDARSHRGAAVQALLEKIAVC